MTISMYPMDQEANDRLLLAEEQRRRDLIDFAVKRFAPELTNKPEVYAIHLYSTNASLRKSVRKSFGGPRVIVVEYVGSGRNQRGVNEVEQGTQCRLDLPESADLVATKSALNSKTEWLAARLKALPVVLPEAEEFVRGALARKGVLVIVGADQG